ncbi:MAG TPA: SRPBCC domain-containing protein [Kofleriaceae bacterium]|jgi:uncharacterized protein YndB with AHSA1/START domain
MNDTVSMERVFKASIAKVWAMWTTPDGLGKWYWPGAMTGRVLHMDVRVGGTYEIAADGMPFTSRGTYTEVVAPTRLASIAEIDFIEGVSPYQRRDLVVLSEVAGGTRMIFTATRLHSEEWQARSEAGLRDTFEKLAALLEGRPLPPVPDCALAGPK